MLFTVRQLTAFPLSQSKLSTARPDEGSPERWSLRCLPGIATQERNETMGPGLRVHLKRQEAEQMAKISMRTAAPSCTSSASQEELTYHHVRLRSALESFGELGNSGNRTACSDDGNHGVVCVCGRSYSPMQCHEMPWSATMRHK